MSVDFQKNSSGSPSGGTNVVQQIMSNSPEETYAIGKNIAKHLCAGSIIALNGTLGSGKTLLVKGIACGLGIKENITSPTYTIINEYTLPNDTTFFHIDAYRLEDNNAFEDIGGLEILNSKGICVIEWSERIMDSLPPYAIIISLEIPSTEVSRLIKITGIEKL